MKERKMRITKKIVQALIKRELGVTVSNLIAEEFPDGTYYKDIPIGEGFTAEIHPYIFMPEKHRQGRERNLIHFQLKSNFAIHSIHLFYDPESFERDYTAEDEYQREIDIAKCDGCFYKVTSTKT